MTRYVIAYRGDKRPEDGPAYMAKWRAWMQSLGAALIDPGAPFSRTKCIGPDAATEGAGAARLAGYSILEADGMDAAVEMAKRCPHLALGTIEVAEVMDMKMS